MFYILNSLKKNNKLRKFRAAKRHFDIIRKEFEEIYSKYNEEQMEESIKAIFNDGEKIVYADGSWILVCDLETYKKNPDRFTWEVNEKTKQGKLVPMTTETINDINYIKDWGNAFFEYLSRFQPTREMSLAKTKLEECIMWAVKGVSSE